MTSQTLDGAATPITEHDLNEKVMSTLQARAFCKDARSVMLYLVEDGTAVDNWRIGHFDPGNGDRYQCKLALRSIFESMSGQYVMIGES